MPEVCGAGVDPLSPTVETANAALITPIVATLIRRGVSHVAWLFCSQVRAPVAPVAAAIAQAIHRRRLYFGALADALRSSGR